jgi:predicted naringenin-chalcone synthase
LRQNSYGTEKSGPQQIERPRSSHRRFSDRRFNDSATILGLSTAVPERQLEQETIYTKLLAPFLGSNRRARTIFRHACVGYRHFSVEETYYSSERTTAERNERYLEAALAIGEKAIRNCLDNSGLSAQTVDDFIIVSCTGIDTPGLDLHLAQRLNMRSDLKRATILGMGCYAALPGLLRATEAAHDGRRALLLAVEICSLHFQPHDSSTESVVSAAIFADGAAAVLIGPGAEAQRPGHNGHPGTLWPKLIDFETLCDYTTFDQMGFHLTDHGFQMKLGMAVPDVLSEKVRSFVERLLRRHGLSHTDIDAWAIHPGGRKILDYAQEQLELPPQALDASRSVLHDYGNMSSPTVLFVLERLQRHRQPQRGQYGVLMAFGPGLTLEAALVQW